MHYHIVIVSLQTKERRSISTPLKLILDEDAQFYLQKNKIRFSSIKLADGRIFQGITVHKYKLGFLQSFVINGNLLSAEMTLSDIIGHRDDIIDLVKALTYAALYRRFSTAAASLLGRLGTISKWNREYPKIPIYESYTPPLLYKMIERYKDPILAEKDLFLQRIEKLIISSGLFRKEDHENLLGTAHRLIQAAGPHFLVAFFLSQSAKNPEVQNSLIALIFQFLKKTPIPDYLSMLIMELSMYVAGLMKTKTLLPLLGLSNTHDESDTIIIWNFNQKHSDVRNERVKMLVSLSNKYSELHNLKAQIMKTSKELNRKLSIQEYYLAKGNDPTQKNTLGLSYLSFMAQACNEQDIYFESFVSSVQQLEQTLFSVSLRI